MRRHCHVSSRWTMTWSSHVTIHIEHRRVQTRSPQRCKKVSPRLKERLGKNAFGPIVLYLTVCFKAESSVLLHLCNKEALTKTARPSSYSALLPAKRPQLPWPRVPSINQLADFLARNNSALRRPSGHDGKGSVRDSKPPSSCWMTPAGLECKGS